jgi:hypothetical protein
MVKLHKDDNSNDDNDCVIKIFKRNLKLGTHILSGKACNCNKLAEK